jgi:glycosyltransferase involved in cell wall biosynthesis
MRIAWFSPLPPVRSGVAAYSAELLPRLRETHVIDTYPEESAHDFVWRARQEPYDLVVYQLGNAPCHDYMWAYLAPYPGLVVLHDARLHQARARRLLNDRRFDDYRRELHYDHPDLNPDVAEYAIEGLGGPIYYFWSMTRVVMRTARTIAVHNARVACDLADACQDVPAVPIETIRMGVARLAADADARARVRHELLLPDDAVVFAAFGKITAEKRISMMLRALGALAREGGEVHLLLVGDDEDYPRLADEIAECGVRGRVRVTGHVSDADAAGYLDASDACLCLRWPTARETSASWLRCLAAGRATVITDLAHLANTPPDVAMRVDLVDEGPSLLSAMRRLAGDERWREEIARAGHAFWTAHHTLDAMADDYRRLIARVVRRSPPKPADLPEHFLADYSRSARRLAAEVGVTIDILE